MSADASAAGGRLASPAAGSGGVIHNIGYRRYDAVRLGRAADRPGADLAQPARRVRHRPRGQGEDLPDPALHADVPARCRQRDRRWPLNPGSQPVVSYDGYIPQLRTVAMLIFVALEAPNLVSSDLRNHTLPLYFARPIRRIDYPVAKLVAFVLACLAHDRDPAAAAVRRHRLPAARREPGVGADTAARSWPAVRRGLGGTARQHRPAARVVDGQAGLRDLRHRHPAVLHLDPGHRARAHRRAGLRPGVRQPAVRRWPAWPA